MTSHPAPVTRRCEDCGYVAAYPKRTRCQKCSGHMLTVAADAVAKIDTTSQAARIRQALTAGDDIKAIKKEQV